MLSGMEPDGRPKGCTHERGCHTGAVPALASATVGARYWLLIEHDGPWAERLPECRLPAELHALIRRATEAGVRAQLIRRPGRRTRSTRQGAHVLLAYAAGDSPWLAEGVFADPDDLDLDALVHGVVPESCILVSEPVFLVCTHAKRNACCARIGLPLARHLGENLPGKVWETSHVGGDRYAANLVCLPHGLYYGNMSEAAALAAANAYRHGEVLLDRFRGRAGIPEPLQAAEHFVRDHTGELSVGGVAVESSRSDGDVTTAVMRLGDARFRVVVEPMAFPTPCGMACAETIATYRLVSLDRLTPVRYATPALT
ncbi:sucrase ferredoxin [Spongiactinospora sp. TRM90649]|uniref:sucrase ferredoxin n=1 Tax=Spongiactinospora sp. TRM90649 TaxID=3031114 RepID=UPI0023F8F40E|nr:sucrase ferredoxin [Spongiactinospora sp. TRM90649]MDF5757868.1 sucrase ferredoxin [Spongiactinospora sp. TRM90649]